MAQAGTPSDLATRPAVSAPGGRTGMWQALLVVIVAAAIIMATSFIIASRATTAGPAADRSYDQIETLRGGANFSAAAGDHSYDSIEQIRGTVPFVDPASDDFQTLRGTMRGGALLTSPIVDQSLNVKDPGTLRRTAPRTAPGGTTVDHRYDDIQSLKSNLR
jgi:hypothetical protein